MVMKSIMAKLTLEVEHMTRDLATESLQDQVEGLALGLIPTEETLLIEMNLSLLEITVKLGEDHLLENINLAEDHHMKEVSLDLADHLMSEMDLHLAEESLQEEMNLNLESRRD